MPFVLFGTVSQCCDATSILDGIILHSSVNLKMQYWPLLADSDQNPKAFDPLCALSVSGVWTEWSHSPVFVPGKKVALCCARNAARQCACGRPWLGDNDRRSSSETGCSTSGPQPANVSSSSKSPHLRQKHLSTRQRNTDWRRCFDIKLTVMKRILALFW